MFNKVNIIFVIIQECISGGVERLIKILFVNEIVIFIVYLNTFLYQAHLMIK